MSDNDRTPGWVWVVLYLALLAALGGMAADSFGSEGDGPTDDGCQSGVQYTGCFP